MQKTLSVIDLTAIRSNARLVKNMIGGRKLFAVVKADAYGHGAEEVALALGDLADGFCVAIVQEGVSLRIAGVTKPILVFTPPMDCEDIALMRFYGLTPSVGDIKSARLSKGMGCHLAINTGMNRYGCRGEELLRVLEILPPNEIVGAYSHLFAPANVKHSVCQLEEFLSQLKVIRAHGSRCFAHLAASGGTLLGGRYLLDGVRCGLMLYGYAPQGFSVEGLKTALKVYAPLSHKTKPYGGGVGYKAADINYEKLFTYRLGYADGFFRGVPLGEGNLCMDAFISQSERPMLPVFTDANAYAARAGTIAYEALCSVTRRSVRVYERGFEI